MVIDATLQTIEALAVGPLKAFEHDGCAVRHDEPVADKENTALAESNLAVILADQARALRDQQMALGRAVIDVFRDLRGDLARKIGLDAGHQQQMRGRITLIARIAVEGGEKFERR